MSKTIFNSDTIKPRNIVNYNAYRGVTDFTNINQFSQYESGYQLLCVLQMPWFMKKLDDVNETFYCKSFQHMLEYEFKGLDGLPDITSDTMEITDGINTQRLINRVTFDTNTTISMEYYEKTGGLITKFSEMYLTGIKDKYTQAKTYHGLIKDGFCKDPRPELEIFTMMYIVTDNTMLRVERGVLLANCQLTKADTNIYNGNKQDINNKPINLEFNCFPIMSNTVDKAAKILLDNINAVNIKYSPNSPAFGAMDSNDWNTKKPVQQELDSTDYKFGVLTKGADEYTDNARGKRTDYLNAGVTENGRAVLNALN